MSAEFPRVLCITNDFGPRAGGIETFVHGLIERMPYGSVTVYTSSQGDTSQFDASWLKNFGVSVIRDKSKILLPTPRVLRITQRLVREEKFTAIFFGAAAPLGLLAHGLRRAGAVRLVALTHGHEVWWAKVWPFKFLLRRIGSGLDAMTYLGGYTKGEIAKALKRKDQESLVHIAPGIDTVHFSPQGDLSELRKKLELHGKRLIVSVGRLVHRKGQDTLVEALPQIIEEFPDAHLLFIGVGPHLQYIHKRAIELGVLSHISFAGRVPYDEIPQFIGLGEIFAMPSRSRLAGLEVEGLGIVYLEASACGLPVVGGKSGGAPDALLEGETGFAVDGRNSADVAEAILRLLRDPEMGLQMGKRGREWIIENWEWKRWSREFNALFTK
jgi:phosphatidylinositol alpha-1,6-mannosyltransferase